MLPIFGIEPEYKVWLSPSRVARDVDDIMDLRRWRTKST